MSQNHIILTGVRQNNLKNLNLKIPHNQLTVITGPSGSGKSSLAFDTIFAEGQRLYIESLSTYARQFLEKVERPDVDQIQNISPTIAIEQKNSVKNSRSTVGTSTEIYDYLRLLFSKIGKVYCPKCETPIKKDSVSDVVDFVLSHLKDQKIYVIAPFAIDPQHSEQSIQNLIKRGFTRAFKDGEVCELQEKRFPAFAGNDGEIWIVLDRLKVTPKIKAQLTDSVEISYAETHGRMMIATASNGDRSPLKFSSAFRCSKCDTRFPEITPTFFSFNNPYGACENCKGFGNILRIDEDLAIPNQNLTLEEGPIDPWTKPSRRKWQKKLLEFAEHENIPTDIPYKNLPETFRKKVFDGTKGFKGVLGFFKKLETKKYKMAIRVLLSRYKTGFTCKVCHGRRLRSELEFVKISNASLPSLLSMTLEQLEPFFKKIKLSSFEKQVSKEILHQLRSRIDFMMKVGLDYLTLDRLAKTLSGGEMQRINIANQLGAALMQTTYVLDEPSIGLHEKDNSRLIHLLKNLKKLGNTVIVVEHDPKMIQTADWILELGPKGGGEGGQLIYEGPYQKFLKSETLTANYITQKQKIEIPKHRRSFEKTLNLVGVTHHNLNNVNLELPLNILTCITGVSGSGKSSLIHDTLYNALARIFRLKSTRMGKFKTISGFQHLKTIRLLDQNPIGKSSRSNPITYIKAYDEIRKLFSHVPESRRRGYKPGTFSFNMSGGRCENCEGTGIEKIEMHFLSDIELTCEHCKGKKFKKEVLEIRYKDKNIDDVLKMTVDEACDFLLANPSIKQKLHVLKNVGLGYMRLGQSATTLSGGESQRLKIAKELSYDMKDCLYILDEPTTGLHLDDIQKLLQVLNRLIDQGNTVVVIEHNLDVIKTADWIIDLGPGGGHHGGKIIAQGTPEQVVRSRKSFTGQFLRNYMSKNLPRTV